MAETAKRRKVVVFDGAAPVALWPAEEVATPAEGAILRTLVYADIFNYPLSVEEISLWAIGVAVTPEEVAVCLEHSKWLEGRVERADGYVMLRGRGEIVALRERRRLAAARLWAAARSYGRMLALLPFVRMIAVTGALALDNTDEGADVDLLIVSAPRRVWLVRALAILVVRLARLGGIELCPNYVLSENALVQQRRDLYAAHEMAQMAPLSGFALFERMRELNDWSYGFMPNAAAARHAGQDHSPGRLGRTLQRALESALGGTLGDRIENWERARKLRRFGPQARQPGANAIVDEEHIKGHFQDYGGPTLAAYYERLHALGVEP